MMYFFSVFLEADGKMSCSRIHRRVYGDSRTSDPTISNSMTIGVNLGTVYNAYICKVWRGGGGVRNSSTENYVYILKW